MVYISEPSEEKLGERGKIVGKQEKSREEKERLLAETVDLQAEQEETEQQL